MPISRTDHDDLVLPLFSGLTSDLPWDEFLRRLLARVGADRVMLLSWDGGAFAIEHAVGLDTDPVAGETELEVLSSLAGTLRPNRVYDIEELLDFSDRGSRERQRKRLASARIGDARLIRTGSAETSRWIAVIASREEFTAADGALLSALAPAVAAAALQLDAIDGLRRRSEAAEDALGLLGISQASINRRGEVLAADPRWESDSLPSVPLEQIEAGRTPRPRYVAVAGRTPERHFLVRPSPREGELLICIRRAVDPVPEAMAAIIERTLGLSRREASLAALLCHRRSIVEAGRELKLTAETARNYSKRIYAKTGTRGQADLVRKIFASVAVLA